MINELFYYLQRPEKGWDPLYGEHEKEYTNISSSNVDVNGVVEDVCRFAGELKDKTLLDLGAGPGYFSEAFYQTGAHVVWQDISRYNLEFFKRKFPNSKIKTELGYLEEAQGQYDVVFNRGCWCYSLNDQRFVRKIISLIKLGGKAYLMIPNEGHMLRAKEMGELSGLLGMFRVFQYYTNNLSGLKIGHPYLSTRRVKQIFSKEPLNYISFEKKEDFVVVQIVK